MIPIKTVKEIEKMRAAGEVAAEVLDEMVRFVEVGVSTYDLDSFGKNVMKRLGAKSAAYHYGSSRNPYPGYACISINDEVVHGIPSRDVILMDGDIVSIDVAVFYNGYVGDNTRTVLVGDVSPEAQKLVKVTEEALLLGISQATEGKHVGDISHAIEAHALKNKFGVLKDFVGHGVGKNMHEGPQVPNYGKAGSGPLLRRGMTLAIEPMFTFGSEKVYVADDGWTVKTVDGSLSAHFEHTILITDNLPEILTLVKK